ncbi:hypothetical protein KAJ83_13345 [Marivibrio halodurans]|uniref:Uncharacterized protein n=1 Tax=Marivibrio halodurans TaxID=2039722 RepID=A0A8J7V3J0_9PROT|nr:hypothetical protein [Marivibrio halodurans]MBP5857997.1 hypothetical protein [Marivibrio halodurans]
MADRKIAAIRSSLAEARALVDTLEFTLQSRKMIETMGWLPEAISIMEGQYRDFLSLSVAIKSLGFKIDIVPNRVIDEFWHMHVLDTEKYKSDCERVFGEMFHHYPYYGMRSEADRLAWLDAGDESGQLWKVCFGYDLYGTGEETVDPYAEEKMLNAVRSHSIVANSGAGAEFPGRARCRRQCAPMKCK